MSTHVLNASILNISHRIISTGVRFDKKRKKDDSVSDTHITLYSSQGSMNHPITVLNKFKTLAALFEDITNDTTTMIPLDIPADWIYMANAFLNWDDPKEIMTLKKTRETALTENERDFINHMCLEDNQLSYFKIDTMIKSGNYFGNDQMSYMGIKKLIEDIPNNTLVDMFRVLITTNGAINNHRGMIMPCLHAVADWINFETAYIKHNNQASTMKEATLMAYESFKTQHPQEIVNMTSTDDNLYNNIPAGTTILLFNPEETIAKYHVREQQIKTVKGIHTVFLPNSIKKIEDHAFMAMYDLKTINLPGSLTRIGAHSFDGTNIEEIIIPSNVRNIGNSVATSYTDTIYMGHVFDECYLETITCLMPILNTRTEEGLLSPAFSTTFNQAIQAKKLTVSKTLASSYWKIPFVNIGQDPINVEPVVLTNDPRDYLTLLKYFNYTQQRIDSFVVSIDDNKNTVTFVSDLED